MGFEFNNEAKQREYIETRLQLDGGVLTTIFAEADDGEVRAFGLDFNSIEERSGCIMTMRQVLKKMRAKQYCFISQVATGETQYNTQQCVMFITCKRDQPGHQTWLWDLCTVEGETKPTNPTKIEDTLAEFSQMLDEKPLLSLSYAQRKKVEKRAMKMLSTKPRKVH